MTSKPTTPVVAYAPYVKPKYEYSHLPLVTAGDVPSTMLMQTLHRALSVKRDHGSMSEARFVAWLVNRLPVTMIDGAGNVHVDLREGPHHRTMFTSHTDTVHQGGGANNIRLDASQQSRIVWRADEGACLGADDGAGVALMMHMIDRKVPGLYVFFRGEECGGLGSSWMADDFPKCLKDIDRCVSFDRAGYSDVITHQGGARCCSDAFALALADALTTMDMTLAFSPSNAGVFTDSANLVYKVAECTNVSVGYKHQHGDGEWQDVSFLQQLADQLCLVDWDALPVERDPSVAQPKYKYTTGIYDPHGAFAADYWPEQKADKVANTGDEYKDLLIEALWDASVGMYFSLKEIVSAWMCPEEPSTYRHLIDGKRMSDIMYEQFAVGLTDGTDTYEEVLDILTEDLTRS